MFGSSWHIGGAVEVPGPIVTPKLSSAFVLDMLTLMSEALFVSGTDMTIRTSGWVVVDDVVGVVESVNMVDINGIEIWGSEIPTYMFGWSGRIDEIGMVVITSEDGGVKVWKIFETWIDIGMRDDTFRIVSMGVGSKVVAVSSLSIWIVTSSLTSVRVLDFESS